MLKLIIFTIIVNVFVIGADELGDLKQVVQLLQKNEESLRKRLETLESGQDQNNIDSSCGDDWISYSDTKCFKVFDIKATEAEAKTKCSQFENSSTLITIASKNEQDYLNKHLRKYQATSDNVWIGLEWVNNGFHWIDGNDVKYANWGENAIKDGKNKCTQMSLTNSELGKWTDDICERKYLVTCQKKQSSKFDLEKQIQNLTKAIDKQQTIIIELQSKNYKQQIIINNHQTHIENLTKSFDEEQSEIDTLKG